VKWNAGRPPAHAELLRRSRLYIAVPSAVIVAGLVALIAAGMYLAAERDTYGGLKSRLERVALEARHLGEPGGYLVFDESDHLLSSGPPQYDDSREGMQVVRDPRFGPLAVLTLSVTADGPHVVAVPAGPELHALDQLRRSLGAMTLAAAVAALFAGYALAGVAVRPLDHAVRDRGEFVALASHQLRTPLSVIRTSAELARAGLDVSPAEALVVILDQARRIEALADRLTRLARAGAGARRSRRTVDLAASVRDLLEPLRPASEQAGVALAFDAAGSVWARADGETLDEAISPVVENAIKFSPRGGAVTVRVRRERRRAIVDVADGGPGIPAADLPHVTRPFFQGGRKRGGYGLGLAIAQAAAVRCGGRVVVTPRTGSGTVVSIVLRSAPPPRSPHPVSSRRPDAPQDAAGVIAPSSPPPILHE
jgi:signal transduction histidine kinase